MKKKFNISELKVKSFVTDLPQRKEKTVKGGAAGYTGHWDICRDGRWSIDYGDCTGDSCSRVPACN